MAIIDGEIACIRADGSPDFYRLLFRREWPYFFALDVLFQNGRDLRGLPLLERKRRLRAIMPRVESRMLYLDHTAERGEDLFRARASVTWKASSQSTRTDFISVTAAQLCG